MVEVTKEEYERLQEFFNESREQSVNTLKGMNPDCIFGGIQLEKLRNIICAIDQRNYFKSREISKMTGISSVMIGRLYMPYLMKHSLVSYYTHRPDHCNLYKRDFNHDELPAILERMGC